MSYLNALITDLRDRKLWPIPLALVAALVAVPVLLSKSPAPVSTARPSLGLGIASTQTGPTVSDAAAPVQVPLAGGGRDPFVQQKLGGAKVVMSANPASGAVRVTSGATTSSASGGSGSSSSTVSTSSGSSTGSSSGNGYYGGSTGTGSTGSRSTGSGSPAPATAPARSSAPAGLSPTEAYHVAISITNSSGGVSPLDPFVRDGALPADRQPRLVELGVAQGAQRILFAVQPDSVVSGPGICTPGPLDCEILSIAPGQTEGISTKSASATVPVAMFQITGISVDRFGSRAAANKARATTDAAGRKLLANSPSSTLSLFQYDPSLDVVVDERNLTVGGN